VLKYKAVSAVALGNMVCIFFIEVYFTPFPILPSGLMASVAVTPELHVGVAAVTFLLHRNMERSFVSGCTRKDYFTFTFTFSICSAFYFMAQRKISSFIGNIFLFYVTTVINKSGFQRKFTSIVDYSVGPHNII
jgi:hypothetical protein